MAEPTQETTPTGETPCATLAATLADLLEWAKRQEADVLILSGKGTGGLVVYKPAQEGNVSSQQVQE